MTTKRVQIISAITWACTMLIIAFILGTSKTSTTIFFILLGGATIHFTMLSEFEKKPKGCKPGNV